MQLKNKLKRLLTGLSIDQEYICLDLAAYDTPLSIYLTVRGQSEESDVTNTQLFLGYKPLILGLSFHSESREVNLLNNQNVIELKFKLNKSSRDNKNYEKCIATLSLRMICQKKFGDDVTFFFEGIHGRHSFLSRLHLFLNEQKIKRNKTVPSNIDLKGNLYDQVRIAYAIPRIISIVTVTDGRLINMFPTDLHGPVNENYYISSLRIGGKANEQVEKYKEIVIADVMASFYRNTYDLGKNHMREMQAQENFLLSTEKSVVFGLPLPAGVTAYREMKQFASFDVGVHRIHLYAVVHHHTSANPSRLVHIHQYFGQWRLNHGLLTNILLR